MAAVGLRGGASLFRRGATNQFSFPSLLLCTRGIAHKLFVAGISFHTTEETLSEAFSQFGQVIEAQLVMDPATNRPRGFGFVKFASEEEAQKAIAEMNGKKAGITKLQVLNGRVIYVDNAKTKEKTTFREGIRPIARGPLKPWEVD